MSLKQKTFTPQHLNIKALTNQSNSDTPKLADFLPGAAAPANHAIEPSEAQNRNHHHPQASVASLATQLSYENTPCLKEPVPNKYLMQTPCTQLYTTCYDDAEESFQTMQNMVRDEDMLPAVLMVQRKWRLKVFRRRLRVLKFQRAQEIIDMEIARVAKEKEEAQYLERLCQTVLMVQRNWRLKQFRRTLAQLKEIKRAQEELYQKRLMQASLLVQRRFRYRQFQRALVKLRAEEEYRQRLVRATIFIQKVFRYRQFQRALVKLRAEHERMVQEQRRREEETARLELEARQDRSARLIQKQWAMHKFRKAIEHYRTAAVLIQRWIRSKHDRFEFLRQRRAAIIIQRQYKARFEMRSVQAVVIQKNWRMWRQMANYSYQMHQIIKLQRWIRTKSFQFKIMALKRSIPRIQEKARVYIATRTGAALAIQRQFRMHLFRERMSRYRNAALSIQRFHRSMSERYLYLRKRTIIYQIQCLYRRVYMVRRHSAALKIQCAWRIRLAQREYQARRIEWEAAEEIRQKEMFIHYQATRIQAWWRGYSVRKETDQILNKIRDRLSIYVAKTTEQNTLGMRIRNSLAILGYPNVSIQQIIIALIDLEKVTRLSPECCRQFTREGAHDILYTFMQNCNRSVPHMDLVKICLQIFINLAKYTETVCQVLEPSYSLAVLSNLIQSYRKCFNMLLQVWDKTSIKLVIPL